jgi:DNA gyrase/topoisomerase IV subunit A
VPVVDLRLELLKRAPAEGEIFLLTTDGRAKRVEQKDFPVQGRYGKGVIAWDLGDRARIAGAVLDKPNHMATIHLSRGAPKSTRLDAAGVRKRASTKGDQIVEVKPGEEVVSVNVGWTVEKFVAATSERANGHKGSNGGKKNGRVERKKSPESSRIKPAAKKRAPARKATVKTRKAGQKVKAVGKRTAKKKR